MSEASLEQAESLPPRRFFLTNTDCFEEDFHVCGVTFADWCLTMEG